MLHNDVPWGLIWFAFLLIVWAFRGLSNLARASQRQAAVAQAKAVAPRPQPMADRIAAASAAANVAAAANARRVVPARPAPVAAPVPLPAQPSARRVPPPVAPAVFTTAHHDPARLHATQLLAPFTHPNRLLASIVVAEALRPPLGLRSFDQR
jgi:hypothetical protein